MKNTHIYTLTDPITLEVRYVGKANNPKQRYKSHLNKARKHQSYKLNWINSLKKQGLKPIIEIIDTVPISEWRLWERYWISQFKTWGFSLVNLTDGGDGNTFGNKCSFKKGDNAKDVVGYNKNYELTHVFSSSISASKYFNLHRSSISACCSKTNRCKTAKNIAWFYKEDIENLSIEELKSEIKRKYTIEQKPNSGQFRKGDISKISKKVGMYDLNWNIIRYFDSARKAGIHIGVTGGAIQYACLKSKKSICKNYKWKYEK